MPVYFCKEFLNDLRSHADPHFARRVLTKVIDSDGDFVIDGDDHRYEGISDAWIRYVSRSRTAYRVIFIRKGSEIYLYRAGEHAIEERLSAPKEMVGIGVRDEEAKDASEKVQRPLSRYLKSCHERFLRDAVAPRRLIPHKSITLVSPFISTSILGPFSLLGEIASEVLANGRPVTIITLPPKADRLGEYELLAERSFHFLFHERLHSKLYLFETDRDQLSYHQQGVKDLVIIGSANLTEAGWNLGRNTDVQEELCYEIDSEDLDDAWDYLSRLTAAANDLDTYRRAVRFGDRRR